MREKLTRVFVLKLGHIVDVLVNHDVQAVAFGMRRHILLGKSLRHGDSGGQGEVPR